MVNRVIVYPSAISQDLDVLNTNKHLMIAAGYLAQAALGTGTFADGLACTPTSPPSLGVLVGTGSIYSLAQIDATAYGSLAADTANQIVKQGIVVGNTTLACPAPVTTGQSVVHLVQAQYQETDGGSTVLPYYNAANPSVPYSGPNNSGTPNYTVRRGVCALAVKTGVAATTGTQVAPAPDAGYTGLYAVTVANGQTTITSGSIAQLATAPFFTKLPALIPAVQAGAFSYAVDTSGSANTIAAAFTPPLAAVTAGQELRIKVANTNTGAVVINPNGLGNISATMQDGSAILPGTLRAGGVYSFISDGTHLQLQRTNNGSIVSFSSGSGTVGGTATAYLGNNSISSSTENNVAFIMPFDYRLSRLYGYPGSVPTMGSRTYTVRVNGADTAVTATASGVTPAASDLTHGVTGVAGDQIDIKLVTSGSDVDIHKVSLMLQQLG